MVYLQKARKNMPILETERLILRDFAPTDWDELNTMLADPLVTRHMHFSSWDEARRRAWLTEMVQGAQQSPRKWYNWAITLRNTGTLIGWLGIGGASHSPEAGTRGCGYALNRHFWGQGYMPEAVRAIFTYEFTVLGMHRILAECETPNTASARVMQKSGMSYEGTFYGADFEGNQAERHHYAITKTMFMEHLKQ